MSPPRRSVEELLAEVARLQAENAACLDHVSKLNVALLTSVLREHQATVPDAGGHVLKTSVHFSSAHRLRGYHGDCERVHGHNYKVDIEVIATGLDELGMGVDFRTVREAGQVVIAVLDHNMINEIPPFTDVNPTAENLASYIFDRLGEQLVREGCRDNARLLAVTVWETEQDSVRYTPVRP
jgi:6-pyruvoyltetrahydropterin/6-carboxytetrahydropterin synthase